MKRLLNTIHRWRFDKLSNTNYQLQVSQKVNFSLPYLVTGRSTALPIHMRWAILSILPFQQLKELGPSTRGSQGPLTCV